MRRALLRREVRHAAYGLRVGICPPGSWGLSFDASSRVAAGGVGYSEWGFVVRAGSGAVMFTRSGPSVSEPPCNLYGEWEALVAGLDWVAKRHVTGARGLRITGDERTVIGQLHGVILTRDSICSGWKALALDQLALLGLPWSAAKVGRGENWLADRIAGGGW